MELYVKHFRCMEVNTGNQIGRIVFVGLNISHFDIVQKL